jgi:hypothetical protein
VEGDRVRIVQETVLIREGEFPESLDWIAARGVIVDGIRRLGWPPGSEKFTIFPESGKKAGEGSGVIPLKLGLVVFLAERGWLLEQRLNITGERQPGKIDAMFDTASGRVVVEWETGNISSSHRAVNKMCLGLMHERIKAGVLVLPTRALSAYLTDRIGNYEELSPYFELWRRLPVREGCLEIIAVEHDATSKDVPRIPKATDGRALR